jgi:cytochrome P450
MSVLLPRPGQIFVTPSAYAADDSWHANAAWLRDNDPVCRVEEENYHPFWAVTRHADILDIERQNTKFLNTVDSVLQPAAIIEARIAQGTALRTLIHMDDPDHKAYRGLTSDWFRPASLKRLEARMAELAKRYVDRMAESGPECDLAAEVTLLYPLHVIMSILGVPESDELRMLKLTQELFGSEDPELRRGTTQEEQMQVILDFFAYFTGLTAERRESPGPDLATVIANGTINGEPVGDLETMSYYVIVATAGHDTTSSSIAGGLEALAMHPDQLALLKQRPELVSAAVDEMIRWVSPVKHFMRTATEPYDLNGTQIAEGDWLLLSYASGNRDGAVFDDPMTFNVERTDADRHLAFGFGAHFCLGAQLARMEMRAFFNELLPRLDSMELAGTPERTQSTFVSGLKRLPMRYQIS